jgi:tripartite-type tricarboxylate transporter receptor subunit TctC
LIFIVDRRITRAALAAARFVLEDPMPRFSARIAIASLMAAATLTGAAAAAEDVAQFYRGKTVTLVIASASGGGFDTYGRLVARHLGAHIPGAPAVVGQNMPGAAGATATYYVMNAAPKDGTVLGAIHPGNIIEPILGDKRKVRYDPSAFQYIGNANNDVYVCVARTDAPAKTFEEALTKEIVVGSSGEGASTRDFPLMLDRVLGAKLKVVLGYSGNREVQLAIERGEIHGQCGAGWSSVIANHPDWFEKKLVRVLVQEASIGHPQLDAWGVPKAGDFAKTQEQRDILDLVYAQERFGRPYVMAPDAPAERVAAMRKAFMDTFHDPVFLAEAKKLNLDVDASSGDEVQALVKKVFATPQAIVEKAKEATAAPQ